MGHKNREIEVKMAVGNGNLSFRAVSKLVARLLGRRVKVLISGTSTDLYWDTPKGGRADFIRLREMQQNGRAQITCKSTDRGSNLDRVEIDLDVANHRQANLLFLEAMGEPSGRVTKRYDVFVLERGVKSHEPATSVVVYRVNGSPQIFVEIEAKSRGKVVSVCQQLSDMAPELRLEVVGTSLYEAFVKGRRIKKSPLKRLLAQTS